MSRAPLLLLLAALPLACGDGSKAEDPCVARCVEARQMEARSIDEIRAECAKGCRSGAVRGIKRPKVDLRGETLTHRNGLRVQAQLDRRLLVLHLLLAAWSLRASLSQKTRSPRRRRGCLTCRRVTSNW